MIKIKNKGGKQHIQEETVSGGEASAGSLDPLLSQEHLNLTAMMSLLLRWSWEVKGSGSTTWC